MAYLQVICLANSRKHQGRCVAGIRTDGGGWIRPVRANDTGALLLEDYRLDNGSDPQPLDLIVIDVLAARPEQHQPENHLVGRQHWKLLDRPASVTWKSLLRSHVERGPALFGGTTDRVSYSTVATTPVASSLALVVPKDIRWNIDEGHGGKRKTRAVFSLGEASYDLAVTDIYWERRLSTLSSGLHPFEAAGLTSNDALLFTVSLGEPFEGECYKLVAAVIVLPKSWTKSRVRRQQ